MEHEESTFVLFEYRRSHLIIEPVDNLSLGGRLANLQGRVFLEFKVTFKANLLVEIPFNFRWCHHKVIETHIAR
jgi:hypothetical protein